MKKIVPDMMQHKHFLKKNYTGKAKSKTDVLQSDKTLI